VSITDVNDTEYANCPPGKANIAETISDIPMKPLKIPRWSHFRVALESTIKIRKVVKPAFDLYLPNGEIDMFVHYLHNSMITKMLIEYKSLQN
jgi:hypothetical protein